MPAVTHTRTYTVIRFADPYKICNACGQWIDGVREAPGPLVTSPCGHREGYTDVCPSWGPVDGCQCVEHLGHRPHAERVP